MSAKNAALVAAIAALSPDELAGIVRLAVLTEENYHPSDDPGIPDEDTPDCAYGEAIAAHPDPDATRTLLFKLGDLLPR